VSGLRNELLPFETNPPICNQAGAREIPSSRLQRRWRKERPCHKEIMEMGVASVIELQRKNDGSPRPDKTAFQSPSGEE
jgi:hypothetical protein